MNIRGISKLPPKQIERIKSKFTKEQKRDILQPYTNEGKKNPDFVKVYGDIADKDIVHGESQESHAEEFWAKQRHEVEIAEGKRIKKIYR